MAFAAKLDGRMEKRLQMAIVVQLARAQDPPANGAELTYTDNVSAHGARVLSSHPWQTDELVRLTSLKDKIGVLGKVAYCQKLEDNRYRIGLNFNGNSATWSAFRARSGTYNSLNPSPPPWRAPL
jgi:hypothetical protein